MERSRCPECGAEIGGENHHLIETNRVANEFDELARRANPNVNPGYWLNPYWGDSTMVFYFLPRKPANVHMQPSYKWDIIIIQKKGRIYIKW